LAACFAALAVLLFCFDASAKGRSGRSPRTEAPAAQKGEVAEPSGIEPLFPVEARCFKIASPFGSPTRYDGSKRPSWAPGGGAHGGVDVSLEEGTPLLALASGTVMDKGEGGTMLGIFIWLKHAPEDTGLPYWVFAKYQHLDAMPELVVGDRVTAGQKIARSGKTGTTGGHYGAGGYPHLHLTARKSPDDSFEGSQLVDPVVLYYDAAKAPASPGPPAGEKQVAIPYVTMDGQIHPPGARLAWPIACEALTKK